MIKSSMRIGKGNIIAISGPLLILVIIYIFISCGGGGTNDDGNGNQEIDLTPFVWKSMNGPPGGRFTTFDQNTYDTNQLFAGVPQGLFLSNDNGKNFQKVGDPAIKNVNSIHFAEDFAIVRADRLYSYDYSTGHSMMINESDLYVFITGNTAYLLDHSPNEDKIEIAVYKIELNSSTESLIPNQTNLLFTTEIDIDLAQPLFMGEIFFTNFFMINGNIFVTVGINQPDSIYFWDEHKLYIIDSSSGSLQDITPNMTDGFVMATVEQDPADDEHLLLGIRSKKANDDFGIITLDKLVMETLDGGTTWLPFTTDTMHSFFVIKDITFTDDGIYFARMVDYILKVDPDDHQNIQELPMTWPVEWLEFDLGNSNIVYANLDIEFGATGFLRSIDNMSTWEIGGHGVPVSSPSNITIHPADGNIVATSGNIAHFSHITKDGGATWKMLTAKTTMGDELVFDPNNPDHMIMITEGADILDSWDMGTTWENAAIEFSGARIFDIEATEQGTSSIYASLNGTGISRLSNIDKIDEYIQTSELRNEWKHLLNCPDYVYDMELDPDNSEIIYATNSPKLFETYSSVWKYDSSKTENLGWTEILKVEDSSGATSIAVDPTDTNRIYTAITGIPGKIYKSDNKGTDWEPLAEELTFSTIHAMAIDPNDDSIVLAAPWGGGLYKSTDHASTWVLLDTPTISISSIVIDPGNSNHFFIGDRIRPVIYETDDGGTTFAKILEFDEQQYYRVSAMALHQSELFISLLNIQNKMISVFEGGPMSGTTFKISASGPVELVGDMTRAVIGFASNNMDLYAVSHIAGVFKLDGNSWTDISGSLPDMGFNGISVNNENIYLAGGCDIGIHGSPRLNDPNIVNNIFTSSDGGATWAALLDDNPFQGPIKTVIPLDDKLVAGTSSGVYTSIDSGETWTSQNEDLDFTSIGALALSANNIYAGTLGGGVYHGSFEMDSSITWDETSGPEPHITHIQIRVHPSDSNTIYATAYPGGVFKSTDRGATWNEYNFALPSFHVPDPLTQGYYALEINPINPENLFLGLYKHGIYISYNGGNTWFPSYAVFDAQPFLRDLNVRRIKFDPSLNSRLYMATDQGVFVSVNGGQSWEPVNNGLTTLDILSIDITENGVVFAGTNGYGIYRYNSSAKDWTHLDRAIGQGQWAAWERRLYQYSALMFDPDMEEKVYLGQFPGGFFISEDNGETWACSSLGLGNDGIFSLSMHPQNHNTLFAGTYNGVWQSNDRGKTWFNSSTGMPGEQWPFCVVIDDEDPNIMYTATKNGMNKGFMNRNTFGGVVMKSLNGGQSWTNIMSGLRDMVEYYQLIIHPLNHDILFLSCNDGVFISLDAGDSWKPFNHGMPVEHFYLRDNVAQNLKMTPEKDSLIMAIHGHGAWQVDISQLTD